MQKKKVFDIYDDVIVVGSLVFMMMVMVLACVAVGFTFF